MIVYTIDLLKKIKWSQDVVISTDSDEIISVSNKLIGDEKNYIVIKRPDEFSTDTASTEVVAFHIIEYMKAEYGKEYDAIITMPPNLPLRTPEMFNKCINEFEKMDEGFDSLNCFLRTDEDLFRKTDDGEFVRLFPNAPRRRQEREPLYIETGSIIITKISSLKKTGSLWGNKMYGYELDELCSVDVHDINDINYLEFLISNGMNLC
jgi:CMP-N-acetylneuraminic acid synthetase